MECKTLTIPASELRVGDKIINEDVLLALAERVESHPANGNRALIREILCKIGGWRRVSPSMLGRRHSSHGGYVHPNDTINGEPVIDSLHGTDIWRDVPDIQESVDAAMEFTRRLLPGHVIVLAGKRAIVLPHDQEVVDLKEASTASTPALAVTAAALRRAASLKAREDVASAVEIVGASHD